jgi:hypothetical protein
MIRHVLLYKFRASATDEQRRRAIDTLRAVGKSIPEVREWSIGEQTFPSKKAYDLAQVSSFENVQTLERFRNHPDHIRARNLMSEISDWVVVDYEYSLEEEG